MGSLSPTTTTLPWSLLLLVHLHILGYPNANSVEYDHDMFNPRVRGLRERAKIMEDILSSYPCSQPTESLAYRTSLTKYLEQIRHQSIYPPKSASSSSSGNQPADLAALWWKDVVVRKSLIEESAGEKFERLIISLSTHVLMKTSRTLLPATMLELLQTQPAAYNRALSQYQAILQSWMRSASLLRCWHHDLENIQRKLREESSLSDNKYAALPTARLTALADAKFNNLLETVCTNEQSKAGLRFLKELSGFTSPGQPGKQPSYPVIHLDKSNNRSLKSPPLPVAAAHHPAYLKKIKRPLGVSVTDTQKPDNRTQNGASKTHAEILLSGYIDESKRVKQALREAALRCSMRIADTRNKLESITTSTQPSSLPVASTALYAPKLRKSTPICFNPKPTKELLIHLGMANEYNILNPGIEDDGILEANIATLRTRTLLPYLSPPQNPPPRLFPLNHVQPQSRIPQKAHPVPSTSAQLSAIPQPPAMTPGKSARSIGRKSVRFSTARRRTGRPSMFGIVAPEEFEDEVDKLVDETNDFPTDDESSDHDADPFFDGNSTSSSSTSTPRKTPKSRKKTPKVNRIWTSGTPASKKRGGNDFLSDEPWAYNATPRARQSSIALTKFFESAEPPLMRLPSFGSSLSSPPSFLASNDGEDSSTSFEEDACIDGSSTPMPKKVVRRQLTDENASSGDGDGLTSLRGEEDGDSFGEDPPSMTLKEILLSADTSNFDLLDVEEMDEDLLEEDVSFIWE